MRKEQKARKLYPSEIARRLQAMGDRWPDDLELFAASGSLILWNISSGLVVATIVGIECDGGDPDIIMDDDGAEYMEPR